MSHDFIQNAVNNLYRDNEIAALNAENARLKAECQARQAENSVLAVECDSLKAEVERLTEAWVDKKMQEDRDALLEQVERLTAEIYRLRRVSINNLVIGYNVAKDGKQLP